MDQLPGKENTYRISSAGFKGLLNAVDPSAVGDEYLYDMNNLMIDAGVLHTVNIPSLAPACAANVGSHSDAPIRSISAIFTGIYWSQSERLTGPLFPGGVALGGDHAVRAFYFASDVFNMVWADPDGYGLYGNGAPVTKALKDVSTIGDNNFNAACAYNGRLYAAKGSFLRFSQGGQDAMLDASWEGDNQYNIIRMVDGGSVHYLFPTRSGLMVIMAGIIYMLTDPWTGSMGVYYTGNSIPTFVNKTSQPYCDGANLYYCCSDGMYVLTGGQVQRLSAPIWPGFSIKSYYAGEYMGRLWFLISGEPHTGDLGEHTYMYALERATGNWEKFDLGFDLSDAVPATLTSICASGNCDADGIDGLYLGTNRGFIYKWMYARGTEEVAPWSLTTKCYVMDESVLMRPVSMRLTYRNTAVGNTMSVQTLIDGIDCGTKDYTLEAEGGVHSNEFELPTHKPDGAVLNAGNLGKNVQLIISGTGSIEISRISLIAKPRGKGEESRLEQAT